MARCRNLKPGFFENEALAECSPLARLLFAGLWCIADREGRLEDRPKRIRAKLLPYDDGSVDDMLQELHRVGFILRYAAGGERFIQVVNFAKHQNPHHREGPSTIPAPDKPETSPRQAQDKPESSRVGYGLPLMGYGLPLMGTLLPESEADASVVASKLETIEPCPHSEILNLFAKHLPTLPQPKPSLWQGKRADNLKARWRWVLTAKKPDGTRYATDRESALAYFERVFEYVRGQDFLMGRETKWSCDLGWLLKAENFAKVIEGNYQPKEATA